MTRAMLLVVLMNALALASTPVSPEGKPLEQSAKPVLIAQDGKAQVAIVVSPKASEAMRRTAGELQGILARITGATFAVETADTPKGITLGTLEQFPDPSLNESMAIRSGYDGIEAYAVRSDRDVLRLLGNTDLGATHAAYRFLELVGYRFFFMGPNWEVVPSHPTLRFDLNEVNRPRIWSRVLGFTRLKTVSEPGDPDRMEMVQRWRRAIRMSSSLNISTRHAWHAIPGSFRGDKFPFKAEFEAHPEYFALVDGQRKPPQFCVTNPGLQRVVTAYAKLNLDRFPNDQMVSLDPADQAGWCTCESCGKLGHHSAQAFHLANIVARELQQSHPGKYVGVLAYSWHSDPPPFDLEPNVFVQLTAGMNASKFSFDELLEAWSKRCKRLGVYEYYSYWEMDQNMLPGAGPQNRIDDMPTRLQRQVEHNVMAVTAEASVNFGVNGHSYYLAHKLMWDPSADLESLKRDFAQHAFGPAAEPMARYYERFNLTRHPLHGLVMLRAAAADLDEAAKLASSRPDIQARITDLKAYMVFNALGMEIEITSDEARKKDLALQWFTWAYRMRNTFLIDWATFRAAVGNHEYKPTLAARFNEPTWNYRVTKQNPWRVDDPLTPQEIEQRFQQVRSKWGEAPDIEPREFAGPIVVVSADGTSASDRDLGFINRAVLLLASINGEPLEFTLVSSTSGIERQDMDYTLATQDGKVLHQGELPEGDNAMKLTVPGPGVYRLTAKRGGKGWNIRLPDHLPAAVSMDRENDNRPQNFTGYFHMPGNTRKLGVHARFGSVNLRDPERKVALTGIMQGDIRAVEVKPNMDGRTWTFTGKPRDLWFVNAPTIISVDANRLFVPRDLAQQENLSVLVP